MSYPTTRTSDDYAPCVLVWPNGKTRRCSVLAVRMDSAETARAKLAAGKAAWVCEGDVERVQGNGEAA